MRRKGAIELSANFIIVIVLSAIIVVGGLTLFFKMRNNTQAYVDTLDQQTEDGIKSMILNNNFRVAVYPSDFALSNGDSKLIGLGLTNIYGASTTSSGDINLDVSVTSIKRYDKDNILQSDPSQITEFYDITSSLVNIPANSQVIKGILIKMPNSNIAPKGQYVYTITVTDLDTSSTYGIVQVYVSNY